MGRSHLVLQVLGCIAAACLPVVIILGLSIGPFSSPILPPIVLTDAMAGEGATMLAETSKIMITLSVGAAVTSAWFYRQPLRKRAQWAGTVVLALVLVFTFTSVFSGLRFLHDMGRQMLEAHIDYELLRGRLQWQGWGLILQTSLLCLAAAFHLQFRDRRYAARSGS